MLRARLFACAFALFFATTPAFATDPAPAPSVAPAFAAVRADARASDADIDRLLQVMDAPSMMDGIMRQMAASQQSMVEQSFGTNLSDEDRARMHDMLEQVNAITLRHLSWTALEPIFRKVYAQAFSKQEVDAMTAFYSSPEGASILKKTPQVLALSMQEIQPIAREVMADVKAMVDKETATPKSRRPRP